MKRKNTRFIDVREISYAYPASQEAAENPEEAEQLKQDSGIQALSKVDLSVEAGQFICILGNNGSGKSTLARHLNALLVPDEGTVWIGDISTNQEEHIWDIRSQVGMVFQNPDNQMIASVVDEEVAFGLENTGVAPEVIRERVKEALQDTGMTGREKANPYYLSGGQKQRVAVAGVLAMHPSCIILDESTSMLDPKGRQEIMDTVFRLNREHGLTIICITHYMEEAVHADRVFVMNQGQVLLSGTPKEIFTKRKELEQAGLTLPAACQLAEMLRRKGLSIPEDVITPQELIEAVRKTENQAYADHTGAC